MSDFVLLVLRLTVGTLLAGHGSQKLFGWFSGPGLKGTHGIMEQLGMKPGQVWGTMAALGESLGGVLTLLGFLNPLGPLNIASAMTVAVRRAHWKMPIWASSGGAELALTNLTVALTLAVLGPGRYSLDRVLGIRLPRAVSVLIALSMSAVTAAALQKPEVAETVSQKVSSMLPTSSFRSAGPDLEVETRAAADVTEEQQATI